MKSWFKITKQKSFCKEIGLTVYVLIMYSEHFQENQDAILNLYYHCDPGVFLCERYVKQRLDLFLDLPLSEKVTNTSSFIHRQSINQS